MKKLTGIFSLVLTLVAVKAAYGANLQFLQYSPVRYFTEQDWEMLTMASDRALNAQGTNEPVDWSNPASGNSGSLVVTGTFEKAGVKCKVLRITNRARDLEGQASYPFCQQPDQSWKADVNIKNKPAPQ